LQADGEIGRRVGGLIQLHAHAAERERFEPVRFDRELIIADGHGLEFVFARAVALRVERGVGLRGAQRDFGVRHNRAGLVFDDAAHVAGRLLRECRD
jgi:hypothetical protein